MLLWFLACFLDAKMFRKEYTDEAHEDISGYDRAEIKIPSNMALIFVLSPTKMKITLDDATSTTAYMSQQYNLFYFKNAATITMQISTSCSYAIFKAPEGNNRGVIQYITNSADIVTPLFSMSDGAPYDSFLCYAQQPYSVTGFIDGNGETINYYQNGALKSKTVSSGREQISISSLTNSVSIIRKYASSTIELYQFNPTKDSNYKIPTKATYNFMIIESNEAKRYPVNIAMSGMCATQDSCVASNIEDIRSTSKTYKITINSKDLSKDIKLSYTTSFDDTKQPIDSKNFVIEDFEAFSVTIYATISGRCNQKEFKKYSSGDEYETEYTLNEDEILEVCPVGGDGGDDKCKNKVPLYIVIILAVVLVVVIIVFIIVIVVLRKKMGNYKSDKETTEV